MDHFIVIFNEAPKLRFAGVEVARINVSSSYTQLEPAMSGRDLNADSWLRASHSAIKLSRHYPYHCVR